MALKRICAWCQVDLGELECQESGITHDICRTCQTWVASEYWLRAEHLAAGLTLEINERSWQLKHRRKTLAIFITPIKRRSILQEADKYLHFQPA